MEHVEIPDRLTYHEPPRHSRAARLRGRVHAIQGAELTRDFVAFLDTALAALSRAQKIAQLADFHPDAADAYLQLKYKSRADVVAELVNDEKKKVSKSTVYSWLSMATRFVEGEHELPENLEDMAPDARLYVLRCYRPRWFLALMLSSHGWDYEQIASLQGVSSSTIGEWLVGARQVAGEERASTFNALKHKYRTMALEAVGEDNEK